MAQFQYTAVNSSGKKLSGIIAAANEDEARKELNTLQVSILSMDKIAETPTKSNTNEVDASSSLNKFEFEAYDKGGKKILGTVPASSRYKAFQRLVDEYGFEVSYVVQVGARPEQRAMAKEEDLSILKAEYLVNARKTGKKIEEKDLQGNQEFELKRQALLKKVDFILEKIKALIAGYSAELRPENKKIIQDYIDKLLRIKSSTNLDYIEHTSEELLKKVQDQEIFLHKEKMAAEHSRIKIQTTELMAELHSGAKTKDLSDDLETLSRRLELSENKFFKGLGNFFSRFTLSPEEKEIKQRIKTVNRQLWTFRKLWLFSPKEAKADTYAALQKITLEKKRLNEEFNKLRSKKYAKSPDELNTKYEPLILEEINSFLAWLLFFYVVAYFLSYYANTKGLNILPGHLNLLSSETLRYLLISIFLWYALFSVKLEYLKYKAWANGLVFGLGILLNAILVFNL